ncbi:exo-alpha-sialidase [Verrucomicrobiaceae bacterium N1E253]|uniref:exo-alpha-sialidase n=1 Tax=Oceaniferula marina TaxID=2748318 RepID=A0A851GAI1_9BACT|nr:sialidase family protein [Oceaniferula marina]NWK54406.1 exo-alpha-sialidase [Oceaniferula marina]
MKLKSTLTSVLLLSFLLGSANAAKQEILHKTSFEKLKRGNLSTQRDGKTQWKSLGKSEVTSKFAKTGKQSLHIFGGTNNTVELTLDNELQQIRGLSFKAERWTSKSPFEFRILAQVNGNWKEVSKLDDLIMVGRGFTSDIVVKLPHEIIGGLRLVCTAPDNAGVLIDDLKLLKGEPENVSKAPEVCKDPIHKLLEKKDIFISGTENTHTFRIPALITAANGDLIACVDARRKGAGDLIWVKDIDIVVKRSSDNGKTWGPMETVIDYGDESVGKPASDPSFILDKTTGEIFCFYNFMDQINSPKEFRLHVQSSKDHGKTWSKPRDITDDIAKPEWKMDFKFITSGRGIQRNNGDLMHTLVNLKRGLHLFGSKDHGKTWGFIDTPIKPANESKVIELVDESLMINSRLNGKGFRGVHRSSDNGKTWDFEIDRGQVDPGCNGSILRYTSIKDGYKKNRLLLCHANSNRGRKNLTVKISYDEGKTWSKGKVIDAGPSAYSSLSICKDGSISVLYEPGYKAIRFARFTLEDLTDGQDKLSKPYRVK